MLSTPYIVPPLPDCSLDESPVAEEIRARAKKAAALAARSAHLAVLHPTHGSLYGKRDGRKKAGPELPVEQRRRLPVKGRATITEADPAQRVTRHPIQLAHSHMLPEAGYVSLQRHGEGCRSDDLVAINAYAWFDLEIREGHAFYGVAPEEVAGIIVARHEAAGVPCPDYMTFSGRGIWGVYLADGFIPPSAKGRVLKACRAYWGEEIKTGRGAGTDRVTAKAAAMRSLWQGGEIDWSVADMSRVHRIAGSVNDKAGETVRLVWPASWADVRRSSFETFCASVLPFTREETQAYLSERDAARQARQDRAAAEGRLLQTRAYRPALSRWAVTADEIMLLIRHHGEHGLRALGLRNMMAHHIACAWALSGRGGDARSWAAELAPLVCGPKLSEKSLASYLKPVEKALRRHEAGERDEYVPYKGAEPRLVSPIYTYGLDRVARELKVTAEQVATLGLRMLVADPAQRKAVTPAERQAAKRARDGAARRADMQQAMQERAARIIELCGEGLEAEEIATRLGCCLRTVERAVEAMFAGASDNVTICDDVADEEVSDGEIEALVTACTWTGSSRYLSEGVALQGTAAAPDTLPAPLAPTKAQRVGRKGAKAKPSSTPVTPIWPPYDPSQRLLALYEHHLKTGKALGWGEACVDADLAAIGMARQDLEFEGETGRRVWSVGRVPDRSPREAALRQRLARLRISPDTVPACSTPEHRLH
ncbi:hypothetical protein ASF36_22620 [Methylobacterium sp. Leaf90]|nr:hypothetical protein ASF36_22620 [Methylobacterium sp. Leaf90]